MSIKIPNSVKCASQDCQKRVTLIEANKVEVVNQAAKYFCPACKAHLQRRRFDCSGRSYE